MDFAPYIFERDSLCNTRFCLEKAKRIAFVRQKWCKFEKLRFPLRQFKQAVKKSHFSTACFLLAYFGLITTGRFTSGLGQGIPPLSGESADSGHPVGLWPGGRCGNGIRRRIFHSGE